MDFFVSRAMQVSCLSPEQIIDLHAKERNLGRLLANFEIQSVFRLQPIRQIHLIPEDGALQEQHAGRVKNALIGLKVARDYEVDRVNNDGQTKRFVLRPWEALSEAAPDRIHEFDLAVQRAAEEGTISFAYEGAGNPGVRLRDKLKTALR